MTNKACANIVLPAWEKLGNIGHSNVEYIVLDIIPKVYERASHGSEAFLDFNVQLYQLFKSTYIQKTSSLNTFSTTKEAVLEKQSLEDKSSIKTESTQMKKKNYWRSESQTVQTNSPDPSQIEVNLITSQETEMAKIPVVREINSANKAHNGESNSLNNVLNISSSDYVNLKVSGSTPAFSATKTPDSIENTSLFRLGVHLIADQTIIDAGSRHTQVAELSVETDSNNLSVSLEKKKKMETDAGQHPEIDHVSSVGAVSSTLDSVAEIVQDSELPKEIDISTNSITESLATDSVKISSTLESVAASVQDHQDNELPKEIDISTTSSLATKISSILESVAAIITDNQDKCLSEDMNDLGSEELETHIIDDKLMLGCHSSDVRLDGNQSHTKKSSGNEVETSFTISVSDSSSTAEDKKSSSDEGESPEEKVLSSEIVSDYELDSTIGMET